MAVRALVFQGPHSLVVEQRSAPALRDGDVLIDVMATGICGSDIHGYTGENGRRFTGQVMGHETVGRIRALGADITDPRLHVGVLVTINPVLGCGDCAVCADPDSDDVCVDRRVIGVDPTIVSAFADQIAVPARNVVVLPDGMRAPHVGALVEPLAVGYRAARRAGAAAGTTLLVIGAGPIGQAAALGARRLGATVTVKEISPLRAEKARSLGFTVVSDVDQTLSAGRVDAVIDAVGIDATLQEALRVSRRGSRVILVGMGAPQTTIDAYRVSTEERELVGSFCYSEREFRETAVWAGEHEDQLADLIDEVVTLGDAAEAFADLAAGRSSASKILVTLGADA